MLGKSRRQTDAPFAPPTTIVFVSTNLRQEAYLTSSEKRRATTGPLSKTSALRLSSSMAQAPQKFSSTNGDEQEEHDEVGIWQDHFPHCVTSSVGLGQCGYVRGLVSLNLLQHSLWRHCRTFHQSYTSPRALYVPSSTRCSPLLW